MITIKEAVATDMKVLEAFLVGVYGEEYRVLAGQYIRCMFSRDYRRPTFVVALDNGSIIGAAAYSEELFTVNVWGISWVSVAEDRRGRGIGEMLVRACLESIRRVTGRPVTVILATYPAQTSLYERLGFQTSGKDQAGGYLMTKAVS